MSAVETPRANDAVEKGVLITPRQKRVHACKVRLDMGAGITRCGLTFLIGSGTYKPDYVYGTPENLGPKGDWHRCPKCEAAADYSAVSVAWANWKKIVFRTLRLTGRIR